MKKTAKKRENQTTAAEKAGVSKMMASYVRNGTRKTENVQLAIALGKLTGRAPIEFLSDKIKGLALKAYPRLSKCPK